MESLSWTGATGAILNPIWTIAVACLVLAVVGQIILSFFAPPLTLQSNADGTLAKRGGYLGAFEKLTKVAFIAVIATSLLYLIAGVVLPYGTGGITGEMFGRFLPVWIALVLVFGISIYFKRSLGLYGKLFDSSIGMVGFALVMFWVFTAIFAGGFDMLVTHDELSQVSGLKNKKLRRASGYGVVVCCQPDPRVSGDLTVLPACHTRNRGHRHPVVYGRIFVHLSAGVLWCAAQFAVLHTTGQTHTDPDCGLGCAGMAVSVADFAIRHRAEFPAKLA